MEKLLYYNPNTVFAAAGDTFPDITRFSYLFKIFNPTVVFIDRTNTISIPLRVSSLFPIPVLRPLTASFEELCNARAADLLKKAEALGVPLYVLWSGGIDSTLMLVSFLKLASPSGRENLHVLLSQESITENPNFYREHIHGKLKVRSSVMFPSLLGTKCLFVTGEHNDQVFGSDRVGVLIKRFGDSVMHRPYERDTFFSFFNEGIGDAAVTNFYLDLFERLTAAAPVPIETNFEHLWWINFATKWQSVFLRSLMYTPERNASLITKEYIEQNYLTFYNTDEFQLWSLNNRDKKIRDAWNTYKWPCKDIIYEYTKDAVYRDTKTKKGSLHFLLLQQPQRNFLTETMKFSDDVDIASFRYPENSFSKA